MQRQFAICPKRNCRPTGCLIDELRRDRRHGRGVGFARLEQITVAIESLCDRRVPHEYLNAFRAEALFDPQRGAGMA